jgi:hypothetical protein
LIGKRSGCNRTDLHFRSCLFVVALFASYHRWADIRPAQTAYWQHSGAPRPISVASQLLTPHRPAFTFAATAASISGMTGI